MNVDQVRSSVARHLGIEIEGLPEADRYIDGVVQVMIDATQNYMQPLTAERFFNGMLHCFLQDEVGYIK